MLWQMFADGPVKVFPFYFNEPLHRRRWTWVANLPNRSSGLRTTRPSWLPAAPIEGSTCGTSARSERSSRRRTPRTVLPSCWSVSTNLISHAESLASQVTECLFTFLISSSTADTRPRSRTSRGTPTSPGSSAPYRRTTSCKCGRW